MLNQTYDNFEIIVVDDGSTDNSAEIIKEYASKYNKVKYFQHENHANKGLTSTILLALKHAKGEYIAFCESDDYWHPDHLEEKVRCICKFPDADIIVNPPHIFGDKSTVENYRLGFYTLFYKLRRLKKPENMFVRMHDTYTFPTFSCVMVKKDKLEKAKFNPPTKNGLDIWLWFQLVVNCKVMYVNKELTYWYRHESNAAKANKEEEKTVKVNYFEELDKEVNYSKFQRILKKYIFKYFDKYIWNIRVKNGYFIRRLFKIKITKRKIDLTQENFFVNDY